MAVDSRQKRFSMLQLQSPAVLVLPNPDGSLDIDRDRNHLLKLYAGDWLWTDPSCDIAGDVSMPGSTLSEDATMASNTLSEGVAMASNSITSDVTMGCE